MKITLVVFLLICLAAILIVSVACGSTAQEPTEVTAPSDAIDIPQETATPVPIPQESATPAPTKWEYKLDSLVFDAECASKALSPHQTIEGVSSKTYLYGYSASAIGSLWQDHNCSYSNSLPVGVYDRIMSDYITCSQQVFDSYATSMGDASWEIVSYSRLQHTSPGSNRCSSIITDYGYEVMWKRPKIAD